MITIYIYNSDGEASTAREVRERAFLRNYYFQCVQGVTDVVLTFLSRLNSLPNG